jgi:hypothetical protein
MNKFIYKIYGKNKKFNWELVDTKNNKEEAIENAKNLSPKEYYKYMIIEHDCKNNSDFSIDLEDLYQECEVVYEDINPKIEVKTMIFTTEKNKEKYNRRKEKDDLRKLAEDYIDR